MNNPDIKALIEAAHELYRVRSILATPKWLRRQPVSDSDLMKAEKNFDAILIQMEDLIKEQRDRYNEERACLDFLSNLVAERPLVRIDQLLQIGQPIQYIGRDVARGIKRGECAYYYGCDPEIRIFHMIGPGVGSIFFRVPRRYIIPLAGALRPLEQILAHIDLRNPAS